MLAIAVFVAWRAFDAWRGPDLDLWHTVVPDDVDASTIAELDWAGFLAAEERVFAQVRAEVTERLPDKDRVPINRYFSGSPVHPPRFAQDWNRSYELTPDGAPRGAVVLLHGLTDAPYSLRHVGRHYRERGWLVIAPRMPGHGTVPAGLVAAEWEDWAAATLLAVREARRRVGADAPLHIVGFSNGGALALHHALRALDDPQVPRPDRLVLISPMVGITAFARFVGIASWPAILPAFARAAWLGVVPEFNPFKYNSFPVNGAVQSFALTRVLQDDLNRRARVPGGLDGLPPILTFQSVVDFTVSTPAVIDRLYARLPQNGSELVLLDLNRSAKLGLFFTPAAETRIERLLPAASRPWRAVVVTNASALSPDVVALVTEPGELEPRSVPLDLAFPRDVFSLSHVALPFPLSDSLYGLFPDPAEDFGATLGDIAPRGERGTLSVQLDTLVRMSSNPFFPFLLERIDAGIAAPRG